MPTPTPHGEPVPTTDATPDYSAMTSEEFDTILAVLAGRSGVHWILTLPGVHEIVAEELNNDVLDYWAARNPEKAFPSREEEA